MLYVSEREMKNINFQFCTIAVKCQQVKWLWHVKSTKESVVVVVVGEKEWNKIEDKYNLIFFFRSSCWLGVVQNYSTYNFSPSIA